MNSAGKDVGLDINETKCISMSHHQNAEQNCNIRIANGFFEQVTK
jgi:hypothetical protein